MLMMVMHSIGDFYLYHIFLLKVRKNILIPLKILEEDVYKRQQYDPGSYRQSGFSGDFRRIPIWEAGVPAEKE